MFPWFSDRHMREYAKAASRYYEILRQREESQMSSNDHIERTKRMIEVMQAYVDGEKVEYYSLDEQKWYPILYWSQYHDYRIAKTPDTINWDHVAPEFKYMARDKGDVPFLYQNKPFLREKMGQWEDENYICSNANSHLSYRKGTVDWKESLVIRPGCE